MLVVFILTVDVFLVCLITRSKPHVPAHLTTQRYLLRATHNRRGGAEGGNY